MGSSKTKVYSLRVLSAFAIAMALAHPSLASAISCAEAFAEPRFSYLSEDTTIRQQVAQKLGFLPELRRTHLSDLADIKLFPPGVEKTKANMIAYSSYKTMKGHTLEVEMTWVREDLRRNGLSRLLFEEILAEHPEIKRIHVSDLVDDNLDIYEKARKTKGKKDSVRTTPLFAKYSEFGFTKIKNLEIIKMKTHELTLPGGKFSMVTQHPAIQFDLVRPK